MAVGVPENEVFAAADRVLARGERPTVERVRVELGRGSPARIGQLLEDWWSALTKRLAGETRLPDLPPAVAEAFKAVWTSATEHGSRLAEAAVAQTAADLAQEQAHLVAERADAQRAVEAACTAQAAAEAISRTAEARLGDLQRLLEERVTQQAELVAQRDALQRRVAHVEQALELAQSALADQRQAAVKEREGLQQHVRATEERAHTEVDRAREEAKAARRELDAQNRVHLAAQRDWQQRLDTANTAAAQAQHVATREQARAEALEQQLAKLAELPATLEATFSRATATAKPKPRRSMPDAARKRSRGKTSTP